MSKTALQSADTTPAVDPFQLSADMLVVVAFPHSRSKSLQLALSIAKTASRYQTAEIGGLNMHVAGFGGTATEAAKAIALIDLIKGWKGRMVFSAGQLLRSITEITELLECFRQANTCRDRASHCHVVIDDPANRESFGAIHFTPFGAFQESPEPKRYLFPCALLFRRYILDASHPSSYQDQAQAAAVKRGIHACPYFDPDDLEEIKD